MGYTSTRNYKEYFDKYLLTDDLVKKIAIISKSFIYFKAPLYKLKFYFVIGYVKLFGC